MLVERTLCAKFLVTERSAFAQTVTRAIPTKNALSTNVAQMKTAKPTRNAPQKVFAKILVSNKELVASTPNAKLLTKAQNVRAHQTSSATLWSNASPRAAKSALGILVEKTRNAEIYLEVLNAVACPVVLATLTADVFVIGS